MIKISSRYLHLFLFQRFWIACSLMISSSLTWAGNGPSKKLPIFSLHQDSYFPMIESLGLDGVHPFASKRYQPIVDFLSPWVSEKSLFSVQKLFRHTTDSIRAVHTDDYLKRLEKTEGVFEAFEPFELRNEDQEETFNNHQDEIAQRIRDFQALATQSTLLATAAAIEKGSLGWAISLSGGFHHAHSDRGSGFCLFSDIGSAVSKLLSEQANHRILIVDLDAHHGDGHAQIFSEISNVAILDIYNKEAFPLEFLPVEYPVPIKAGMKTKPYHDLLTSHLRHALDEFQPSLVYYVAGTDIYSKDPIGGLQISRSGILLRDEIVFKEVLNRSIPIVMTLAGGYHEDVPRIIADSIGNLIESKVLPTF